jgi:hypothetical protein
MWFAVFESDLGPELPIWRTVQGGWGWVREAPSRTIGQKRTRLAHQEKRGKVPEQRVSCVSGE